MLKNTAQLQKEEKRNLAPYAMKSFKSIGRVIYEPNDNFRTPFERDRGRIMHCKAFRRLQAKTQVFVAYYGDHYRDRLTHSIEVSQIARDLSRTLGLNEDLSECLALAHDLGHPPFGHGGEDALNEVMQEFGLHFEHNEHSRRIVQKLEKISPDFDGLNLTKEVLDGMLKHNPHNYETYLNFKISPHLEGQVVDLSDEIAYTNHDIDDSIRAEILEIEQFSEFKIWQKAQKIIEKKYGKPKNGQAKKLHVNRIISQMISQMIHDLQTQTSINLQKNKINTVEKVRLHHEYLVTFSKTVRNELKEFRSFLLKNFYMHPKVRDEIEKGKSILKKLFKYYINHPNKLPEDIITKEPLEIIIKDYIAGMTDHYAAERFKELI